LATEYTCHKYIKLCANEYCINPHHIEKIFASPSVYVSDILKQEEKNKSETYDVQDLIKVLEDLVNALLEIVTIDKDETDKKAILEAQKSEKDETDETITHV